MFHLGNWRWLAGGAAITTAVLIGLTGVVLSSASAPPASSSPPAGLAVAPAATGPSAVTMQSVSAADLAAQGITLQQATSAAAVTQTKAAGLASARFPGSTVREIVLAQVTDNYSVPVLRRTCWVVSLTPPAGAGTVTGGPPPGRPHKTTYLILFFDAQSGAFVEGIQGGSSG